MPPLENFARTAGRGGDAGDGSSSDLACEPPWLHVFLGHSQIGITMNLYAHVMPEALHEAAGRMDAALGSSPRKARSTAAARRQV
jgi:hypothetical protein